jgi:putative membrane protein
MNPIIEKKAIIIIMICMPVLTFIVCTNQTNSKNTGTGDNLIFTSDTNTVMSKDDVKFLVASAEISLEEINLGKLAQTHANMSEIKEMGKKMKDDYMNILTQLKNIAANKSISLPNEMDSDGKDAYEKLMVKNGSDFDEQFSDILISTDKNAVGVFEKEVQGTKNTDIKAWAASLLLTLKTHLTNTEYCQEKCKKIMIQ